MNEISIERLRDALSYDPKSGMLYWKHKPNGRKDWNTRYAGKPAFTSDNGSGYRVGAVNAKKLYAHRVAWAIYYGNWPDMIDHINGNRSDNRIENLRSVDAIGNARNCRLKKANRSGVAGVSWSRQFDKWRATIGVARRSVHIGLFDSLEEAIAARSQAEKDAGFHKNHGRAA